MCLCRQRGKDNRRKRQIEFVQIKRESIETICAQFQFPKTNASKQKKKKQKVSNNQKIEQRSTERINLNG